MLIPLCAAIDSGGMLLVDVATGSLHKTLPVMLMAGAVYSLDFPPTQRNPFCKILLDISVGAKHKNQKIEVNRCIH